MERDLSALTSEEKLAILRADSPELLPLLTEVKQKMNDIRTFLKPIISKVQSGELSTSKGMSFLELKCQLLLSYCTHAVFYLLLKAEGGGTTNVSSHPVIKQLVHIRTILEKMRPIEKKLKYQIDKLLKQASTNTTTADNKGLIHFNFILHCSDWVV